MNDIDKNSILIKIVNEDGTEFCYPQNPLKEKWDKLYPPTRYGEPCSSVLGYCSDGTPIMNYSCVLCSEEHCQYSNSWEVPEEDLDVWKLYLEQVKEYNRIHNPSLIIDIENKLRKLKKMEANQKQYILK